MDLAQAVLEVKYGSRVARVRATRIRFSARQCFTLDDDEHDRRCLEVLARNLMIRTPGQFLYADDHGEFLAYLLRHAPELKRSISGILVDDTTRVGSIVPPAVPVFPVSQFAPSAATVFLCETRTYPRWRMRRRLSAQIEVLDPDVLVRIGLQHIPARAWVPAYRDTIYPIEIPEIAFEPGMDLILIDCPARNLGLMPNGVGYVHNALKRTGVRYQTLDLDIIIYHRFHVRRIFDEGGKIRLANGRELPSDPWQAEHYDLWADPEVIEHFRSDIDEIVAKLTAARPKILAMSIQACNEQFSAEIVRGVKRALPDTIILVGGFSCYNADIGLRAFPLADYMCIGEADITVGSLVERLAAGERPRRTPGVLSSFDADDDTFIPGPMPHDLDVLEFPKYEWYDLSTYRNFNGYQLTPVIASRGCRWSRCTFCAERFYWRIRSPKAFVDELEWLVERGCRLFMFNESDLNGMPEVVLDICDEIIRRRLAVKLTGQLRIHKRSDRRFFERLRAAGFVALRFGVDAFSENALRLQKKGYTKAIVRQNLRDCWGAGIYTEVNWVIGVPGEAEADVEEGVQFLVELKPCVGRIANINPLILVNGSVYWLEPEAHNIRFRGSREDLYARYPRAIPAHLWYSVDPYIDEKVRKRRFERIVLELHRNGFDVGAWAARVIQDVRENRDVARVGSADDAAADSWQPTTMSLQ